MERTKILRVNVHEKESGCCIFDQIYSWRGNENPQTIASLVKVFVQFSSEVDNGEITRAIFDKPNRLLRNKNSATRRTIGMGSVRQPIAPQESISIVVKTSGRVVLSVFHDTAPQYLFVESIAEKAVAEFVAMYDRKLRSLDDRFRELGPIEDADPAELNDIKDKFNGFKTVFQSLENQVREELAADEIGPDV